MKRYHQRFDLEGVQKNENFCVKYLNSFVHEGPHGSHMCVVYEYYGITLEQLLCNPKINAVR